MNRFSQACLLLIVLLLIFISVRLSWTQETVKAAATYKYMVQVIKPGTTTTSSEELEKAINFAATMGFEPVSIMHDPGYYTLVLRSPDQ